MGGTPSYRKPDFLSYSALKVFEEDPGDFYQRYMNPARPAKPPQADYMAVGSAFDALVKNAIYTDIHGSAEGTPYAWPDIFHDQVEELMRPILPLADNLFQQYKDCGAYASLLLEVVASPEPPRMEFTVKREIEGVPLLGKPDLKYTTIDGLHVIADWKMNGSTSKTGASPQVGYRICFDYGSRTHRTCHKKFSPVLDRGVIRSLVPMDVTTDYWGEQMALYAWLLGEPVGSQDFVAHIEQVACRPVKGKNYPRAKFAQHVALVSEQAQRALMERFKVCWNAVQTEHVFVDSSKEVSDHKCWELAQQPPRELAGVPLI
jgi:hypothetical protein